MILELNYIIDRNTYVANMMAGQLADQLPGKISSDLNVNIPHTRASFKIHVSLFLQTQKCLETKIVNNF